MIAGIGCASTPPSAAPPPGGRAAEPGEPAAPSPNPFAPVRVRILPLTHLVCTPTGARLDVHLELLDAWGLPTRALGTFRLTARFDDATTAAVTARLNDFAGVATWTLDMTDPALNATRYYDRVTRDYRVTVAHPALAVTASPFTLEVYFEAPGAVVLPATATVAP